MEVTHVARARKAFRLGALANFLRDQRLLSHSHVHLPFSHLYVQINITFT